ncbi:hypothetical protein IMSAGC022_00731 [Alistipes sp.]|nr:hypothetical protein IMSAGC022_00731 [Alistipes sp.]
MRMNHGNQFVLQKWSILQIRQTEDSFNQSQVNPMFLQSSFHSPRISINQRKIDLWKLGYKLRQQRRKYILRNRSTGSQLQFADILIMQQMHLIFQLFIIVQNLFAMFQQ